MTRKFLAIASVALLAAFAVSGFSCATTSSTGQVVSVPVTSTNAVSLGVAAVQANCPATSNLLNGAEILTPIIADLIGDPSGGTQAITTEQGIQSACNKVTGQLATGTTAVAPVLAPATTTTPAVTPATTTTTAPATTSD